MTDNVAHIVIPGRIISSNDGDVHWISAHQIMRLCGLNERRDRIYIIDQGGHDIRFLEARLKAEGVEVKIHTPARGRFDAPYCLDRQREDAHA